MTWSGRHAIAPGAKIDLIECNSNGRNDLYTGVKTAAELPGVSVVSMSFVSINPDTGKAAEFSGEGAYDDDFTTPPNHRPVTFLASTGDNGSPGGYPAYSPNVVAVGATSLSVAANNSYGHETGWGGSGGGVSKYEPEPAYQYSVQTTGKRTTPDVAFDANPSTGVVIYDSYDDPSDPWSLEGGTSMGTPCWAGLIAIADQIAHGDWKPHIEWSRADAPGALLTSWE